MTERLLRMPANGGYATRDGRFYAKREDRQWRATDALPVPYVEQLHETLRDCRAWFVRRRKVRR